MPAEWLGKIATPSPNISVGKPVKGSAGTATLELAVDGKYHTSNGALLTAGSTSAADAAAWAPGWISINVGTGPSKVLLTWLETGYNEFNKPASAPAAYDILTSSDSTDGQDGTWTSISSVSGEVAEPNNLYRGRSHVIDFTGKSWVRFLVTKAPATGTGLFRAVRVDEISIYDISTATAGARDTWLIMGDSITKMSFERSGADKDFDQLNHAARSAYFPAVIGAGIGGEFSKDAVTHATEWLSKFEGIDFVTFAYGTNDSWGNKSPAASGFEANVRAFIDVVKKAGKTPVLARAPFSGQARTAIADYNAIIQSLTAEFKLPCGPDLYTWFAEHQCPTGDAAVDQYNDYTTANGALVHPSDAGKRSINRLYSEALLPLYPAP
jgi:lysophospholipase L1-like esterase